MASLFVKKTDMELGCWQGEECMCEGKGNNCTAKGVVYQATCETCVKSSPSRSDQIYIGETARQVGTRALEHVENVKLFKHQSFILEHWMNEHPTSTTPPVFTFKVLSKHSDALSRQVKEALVILQKGKLNKRNEFSINEIITMESSRYAWEESDHYKKNIAG